MFGKKRNEPVIADYNIIKGDKIKKTKIISKKNAQAMQIKYIELGYSKNNQ